MIQSISSNLISSQLYYAYGISSSSRFSDAKKDEIIKILNVISQLDLITFVTKHPSKKENHCVPLLHVRSFNPYASCVTKQVPTRCQQKLIRRSI